MSTLNVVACYRVHKVLAIFIGANTRIIGDREMKVLKFPDNTTIILLRGINCHTIIQSILKSYGKIPSSKTNFSKIQTL